MRLTELAEAIAILQPYFEKPNGFHVGAEHDEIHLYATDRAVSAEDIAKLLALGWFQPGGATEDCPDDYSKEEGWTHFT